MPRRSKLAVAEDPEAVLDSRQARALELFLSGKSTVEVAAELDVDRSTAWRWTQEPRFAAELRRCRGERLAVAREVVAEGAARGARYLAGLVDDADAPPALRLRAALALLDRAGVTEPPNMEARLAGLEDVPGEVARVERGRASYGRLEAALAGLGA